MVHAVDTVAIIAGIVGIVGTISGIGAVVWATGRVKGIELTLDLLSKANDALRVQLADQEKSCMEKIDELRKTNEVLLHGIAERIGLELADRIGGALDTVLRRQPPWPNPSASPS